MKKVLAVLMALALVLTMCSFAAAESGLSGKLTIWAWGADAEAEQREAIIQAFIKNHPELEVEYSIIPTADSVWDQKAAAALTSLVAIKREELHLLSRFGVPQKARTPAISSHPCATSSHSRLSLRLQPNSAKRTVYLPVRQASIFSSRRSSALFSSVS